MADTLEKLLTQSKFNPKEKEAFKKELEQTLQNDNHDIALEEKLTIVSTCFDKTVNSVITQMPDLEELYEFKKCVRKYARVKMRAVNYYHYQIHDKQDYLLENINMFKPFLR